MKRFGVDISRWQGDFDMAKAKAEGVTFVIVKGGGGDSGLYVDRKFAANYDNAKRLGLPVGCYWYSKALTVAQALQEANYFYEKCLKGRQFELPVYMDVEQKDMLALGKRALTDIIKAFLNALTAKGYFAGIYSSKSMFGDYMYDNELAGFPHWVAQWATACTYSGQYGMWQFGGEVNKLRSNRVAGVLCDQDYMLVDYPTAIKAAGVNGFTKTEVTKMTEAQLRQNVVDTILGWVGLNEADGSHKKIVDIYNSHKPLARGYALKYTDAWCAGTVSAVAIVNNITDIMPTEVGVGKMIDRLKASPAWENLLVVLVADHGYPYPRTLAYNEPLRHRIPMIWTGGAVARPRVVEDYASQIDIAATLLAQLGVPHGDFDYSKDIFAPTPPRKFAYYAFNDGFGVVDASGEAVWDATGGRAVTETNPELLDVGRTMLQTTYVDIGRR